MRPFGPNLATREVCLCDGFSGYSWLSQCSRSTGEQASGVANTVNRCNIFCIENVSKSQVSKFNLQGKSMSNQQSALPNRTQGKVFSPLIGMTGNIELDLRHMESAVVEPLAISPADINVNLLTASEIEGIQFLRKEINLELHHQLDPDFISHEKKEMN